MPRYRVKNFAQYQVYKDNRPMRFIRLDCGLLDDPDLGQLDAETWRLAIESILVAAAKPEQHEVDIEHLEWRLRRKIKAKSIEALESAEFWTRTDPYESVRQRTPAYESVRIRTREEKSREEERREELLSRDDPRRDRSYGFEECYRKYPHWSGRSHKSKAMDIWKRRNLADYTERVWRDIVEKSRMDDWTREEGRFVPAFERYLRDIKDPDIDLPPAWEDADAQAQ